MVDFIYDTYAHGVIGNSSSFEVEDSPSEPGWACQRLVGFSRFLESLSNNKKEAVITTLVYGYDSIGGRELWSILNHRSQVAHLTKYRIHDSRRPYSRRR